MSHTVLILGASSAIAERTARCFAREGARIALGARDVNKLHAMADDLKVRGAEDIRILPRMDALDDNSLTACLDVAWAEWPDIDVVLIAHGHLPDQEVCEEDAKRSLREIQINFTSVVTLCTTVAERMADRNDGVLGVISSVAGLRGRQSNYIYGAAKGGLNIFLQGLRNRLHPNGVRVLTILPGFVDTPMTADLPKGPLFASADVVGSRIHKALVEGKPDILYVPWFWRWIMLIIRMIPEFIFKKLSL